MENGSLPPMLQTFLHDFIARRRRLAIIKATALAIAAGLAIALLACIADRFFKLPGYLRGVLLVADFAAIVFILRRPMLEALATHAHWVEAAQQIESLEPAFAQRLITVTSQLQSPESHRGSPGMLAALIAELTGFTQGRRAADLLHIRRIARSLTLAGAFLAITLAALVIPWLNLPRLMARFTRPWADIPPVTTTQLGVDPGSTKITQGRPMTVLVSASHLGDSPVRLFVRENDGWATHDLDKTNDGRYAVELPPRDRSTQYYVTGGDARSPLYDIHVITVPGLVEVRARVQYPPYLHWPDKPLTLADGKLEVPIGSEVSLSLVGTEPLADATLQPKDGKPIATAASVDPAVRTAKVAANKDVQLVATLTSQQGVTQPAAQPISIKALPDRPPLVRLLVPDQELRLNPTDVLTTACQAMDDYGIESLTLAVKVNDRTPIYQPIPIRGDRRRVEMTIDCDLAGLAVNVGDVLQVQLLARDGAGQQRGSDTLRAVISPRSYDLNAYLRQNELKNAQKLLAEAAKQVAAARQQIGQPPESVAKDGDHTLQGCTAAAQLAQQAQGPLLRAAARADRREVGDAIAGWFDAAEHTRAIAETAADMRSRAVDAGQIAGVLDEAVQLTKTASEQLAAVVKGQAAMGIRDDVAAAKAVGERVDRAQPADREKLQNAAKRLSASAETAAREAGVDVGSIDQIIAVANGVLQPNQMQFELFARIWRDLLERLAPGNVVLERARHDALALEPRLAAAAAVEMVRPDADFTRARDLSLAARAGERIAAVRLSLANDAAMLQAGREYPEALRDLQAEHRLVRQPQPNGEQVYLAAKSARDRMRKWAGEADPVADTTKSVAEDQLALETAAAMQKKQFDQAKKLESKRTAAQLDQQKQRQQQLAQQAQVAQRLEELRKQQEQLAKQTAKEQDAAKLQQLAQAQQQLAQDVQKSRDEMEKADADDKARQAEEKQADTAIDAIAAARRALGELKSDNADVRQAPDDNKRNAKARELDPSNMQAANEKLAGASPMADDARKQIDDKVLPEARSMQQDARANDNSGVSRRAENLDREIAEASKKLDAAEEKLAERDALAAAESGSRQAAQQMAQATQMEKTKSPANAASQQEARQSAQAAQARVLTALEQAADRAARRSGGARVRELPAVADLLSLVPLLDSNVAVAGSGGAGFAKADLANARDWGRLRARDDTQQAAVAPVADPPGYESALRAYFDALGKEK
jgi:hypothetical protein